MMIVVRGADDNARPSRSRRAPIVFGGALVLAMVSGQPSTAAPPVHKPLPVSTTRAPVVAARPGALSAAVLLRYVDDAADKNGVDRAVGTALARVPGARAIAERIAQRIRALPQQDREAALGGRAALTRAVTVDDFSVLASPSIPTVGRATVGPRNEPAESTPAPKGGIRLSLSGVESRKAADADGKDELVVVAGAIAQTRSEGLRLVGLRSFPSSGTSTLVPGKSLSAAVPIYLGSEGIVLVTAVLEDDAGDAVPRAAEIQLLTELAIGVATARGGPVTLDTLETTLADAFGLLRLQKTPPWSERSVVARVVRGTEWSALLRAKRTAAIGSIDHRLETRHDTDGGDYSVYFDVRAEQVRQP